MKRRDIVRLAAMGATTLFVLPAALTSCEDPLPEDTDDGGTGGTGGTTPLIIDLTLPAYAALANSGGFVTVSNIIVINTGSGNYTALSSVCTHEGCAVTYNSSANNLPCPCHGSVFAIGGSVLNGPATQPLKVYPVTKTGNTLSIQR